jgi:hypothetical protein
MALLGFTAEISIYKTSSHYRSFFSTTSGASGGVFPQYPVCTDCVWNTYDYPVPTCAKLCIDAPRQLEYPVECDPSECPPRNCCPPGCVTC